MRGVIVGKDVLGHPILIVHLYGIRVFGRALYAVITHRRCTFLDLAFGR